MNMQQELLHILSAVPYREIVGSPSRIISSVHTDSRKVEASSMFIACVGVGADGHNFIPQAIERGACAIVCEHIPEVIDSNVSYILVSNSAYACGHILRAFYAIDFSQLQVVGITGTNGKTTTATLLYNLFEALGYTSGLISTVRNYIHTRSIEATHTTPDSVQLYQLLYAMQQAGCTYCFMEVSSHAIHQHRIAGLEFAGVVFTNITQDHLDYHHTFAEYLAVKKSLFDTLPAHAFALVNNDDTHARIMLQNCSATAYTYSLKSMSTYKAKIIETLVQGTLVKIDSSEVWLKLIGVFNVYNALSVYAVALLLGQERQAILQTMSMLEPVEGRIEFFRNTQGITAVVDYAHTPDALQNVLHSLRELIKITQSKIITVVGAGGNRDTSKRPLMGKIAADLSDMLFITADNPRYEEPDQIARDMLAGIPEQKLTNVLTILDRKQAIKTALLFAKPGDIVLVAGKGHETYQEIRGEKHHFDDREIIKEFFNI